MSLVYHMLGAVRIILFQVAAVGALTAAEPFASGFEDLTVGSTPAWIRPGPFGSATVENVFQDLYFGGMVLPTEGTRLLRADGTIEIVNPSGEPFQSFAMDFFISDRYQELGIFNVNFGGVFSGTSGAGQWGHYEFAFDEPRHSLQIAAVFNAGENFDAYYAIDNIRIAAVPEPSSGLLAVLIGIGLVVMRRRAAGR